VAVAAGIVLSRLFGLVRQRAIGHFVGTGDAGDVIAAAMRIPNVLQNLLGEGVLSASFVPVYARLRADGREEDARRLARAVFQLLAAISAVVVLLGVACAPALVAAIAPGFSVEKRQATVTLVRVLFPGMGVLVLSAWCLGVLNAHRRFFVGYAAPIAWNIAIIVALLWQGSTGDAARAAWLVAAASVLGSVLQFGVQLPWLVRVLPASRGKAPRGEVSTVIRNFGPAVIGRGVVQVGAWIDQLIASLVAVTAPGAAAVLFYAQNIALLPVSVFGMSISVTELTEMAEKRQESVPDAIKARLEGAVRRMAFFIVPCAAALFALGDVAAAALLETGNFRRADSVWAWGVLAGSSIGLLAGTLGRVYNSAFYALHDTRTPVRFALIRLGAASALGFAGGLLLPGAIGIPARWGVAAITVAAGLGAWIEFALLRRALAAKIGPLPWPSGLLPRLWGMAALAAAAGYGAKVLTLALHPVARGAVVFAVFGAVYLALTSLMRIPEARTVLARLGAER
jgi:putative peptidoglycan lipid II flippase